MERDNYWVSLWLCLVLLVVFILQQMQGFTELFILDGRVVTTKIWTLVTTIFLHGDLVHLLYNIFGLALFGIILEHIIGTKKFLYLFFAAGLMASFASLPFYTRVLGASGAIFGVIGMLGVLRPKLMVWVYGMPMPMFLALAVWAAADVFGIFVPSTTANIAHLAGLALGIAAGFYYRKGYKEKEPEKEEVRIDEEKVREWEKQF